MERPQESVGPVRRRASILIFCSAFPPAFVRGGPARSIAGFAEALGGEHDIHVVTSAHDAPGEGVMTAVVPDTWQPWGPARVWYESAERLGIRRTLDLIRQSSPDAIYLNSVFNVRLTLLPMIVAILTRRGIPILLAPRGELSPGALALKERKKRIYLTLFRLVRLHRRVAWQASAELEEREIISVFPDLVRGSAGRATVSIAPNLRQAELDDGSDDRETEPTDGRSLVFFSRIVPKKNLDVLLDALALVPGSVRLAIAGPIEDHDHWRRCQEKIAGLPPDKHVEYVGLIAPDDVVAFLSGFDLFVLPTRGENFGHAIFESLLAGTPVIVGRDTPWSHAEDTNAGWLCDPRSPTQIAALIERFWAKTDDERQAMRAAARRAARSRSSDPEILESNRAMVRGVVASGRRRLG